MNNKLSPFQMIFFGAMAFFIVAGVIAFSVIRAGDRVEKVDLIAWGTASSQVINNVISEIDDDALRLTYRQFSTNQFESELINALAAGTGPDLVFMTNDLIMKHENKLFKIGYDSYPQKQFKDNFIEAGEVLMTPNGIIGFPYIIDPLVLYWNRSMLNSAGIARVPSLWNEVVSVAQRLTSADENLRISKSAIAFGEFRNIKNAKDIIVALTQQSGNDIVVRNESTITDDSFVNLFNQGLGFPATPANAAVNFYTQFSNPSLNTYSWNRSLPNSEEMFLAGDLAFYVGYASEYPELRRKNPNLNFDVAVLPQSQLSIDGEGGMGKRTLGKLTFIGIVRNTPKASASFRAMNLITNSGNISLLGEFTNLPPVRRDLLSVANDNAILQTFYDSALIARPFVDPDSEKTDQIFMDMIESYTSGRESLSAVIMRAHNEIDRLIK